MINPNLKNYKSFKVAMVHGVVYNSDMEREQKMRLLYGTGNPAKLDAMRRRLAGLKAEIIGLGELNKEIPEVLEDGATPLENARQKALAYYEAFGMPVFSCDSGLYIEELSEELQPSVHVRTVNGKYLTDEEMIEYYSGLAKKYCNLTAWYKNAICLILDKEHIYESMEESLASKPFIITSIPHRFVKKGFPLDSLSVDIKSGKYYYDLEEDELDQVAVEDGFLDFFQRHLGNTRLTIN
jgi:8-oxo-dGTP diphosphatase